MELKAHLKALGVEAEREAFATRVGSSLGHLRNVCNGYRPCAPELAVAIERESSQAVMRWDMRPDDWWRIWPELVSFSGAPEVPSKAGVA